MSSMIEDLPGPQDNLELQEIQQNEMLEMEQRQRQQRQQQIENSQQIENFEESTPIKLEFKKKSETEGSIFDLIKSEFNINNLVILVAIYIACIPESNEIIRKALSTFSNNAYSHFIVTIIKCIVLLLIIILVKHFYTKSFV